MAELIRNDNLDLAPNTDKSNLSIKKRKKAREKVISDEKAKRKLELEKIKGANIIFGLDNGATRNSVMHSPLLKR